jgi:hypothetical protein
MVGKW